MFQRKPNFVRSFLFALMLVIGPVQVQAVMACAAMDRVMHAGCDCEDEQTDGGCLDSGADSRCEQTVELSINDDARLNTPIVKTAETGPDIDLFQSVITSFYIIELPRTGGLPHQDHSFSTSSRPDSEIYLITQRLRI